MKSIANQYKDLKEGKMSQANFMRNLRMSMPQVTNVMSFGDAVKVLKNKGIITEAPGFKSKPEETPKVKSGDTIELDGMLRDLYGKPFLGGYFLDYSKVPHELVLQISKAPAQDGQKTSDIEKLGTAVLFKDSEWSFNNVRVGANEQETLDKIAALAYPTADTTSENKDPNEDAEFDAILKQLEDEMAGEEEVKGQYDETLNEAKEKTNPNKVHPQEYTMGIKYELKCFKGDVVKAERAVLKNLAKEPFYYTALKLSGKDAHQKAPAVKAEAPKKKSKKKEVELVDTINAMQKVKMPKKEEKKKLKEQVDKKMNFQDLPADSEKYKIVKDSKGYIIKATNADGVEFQKGDDVKINDGEEIKIVKFEENQGKVKAIYSKGMFFAGIDINDLKAGKPEFRPGVDMGKSFEKIKEQLRKIVRQALSEEAPSKQTAASEITAKAVEYIDDYNEGEKTYKKSQLENVFDSYEDKVGHRFGDSVFENVIDMLKAKGYTMAMKEMFDGRDNLTNISDDTK